MKLRFKRRQEIFTRYTDFLNKEFFEKRFVKVRVGKYGAFLVIDSLLGDALNPVEQFYEDSSIVQAMKKMGLEIKEDPKDAKNGEEGPAPIINYYLDKEKETSAPSTSKLNLKRQFSIPSQKNKIFPSGNTLSPYKPALFSGPKMTRVKKKVRNESLKDLEREKRGAIEMAGEPARNSGKRRHNSAFITCRIDVLPEIAESILDGEENQKSSLENKESKEEDLDDVNEVVEENELDKSKLPIIEI